MFSGNRMRMYFILLFSILALGVFGENAECGRNGGKCMPQIKCTRGLASDAGLCSAKGHECCNTVDKEYRCRSRFGGECIADCPENIWHLGEKSRDCGPGLRCCVWLF